MRIQRRAGGLFGRAAILAILILVASSSVLGDTLVLKDGRTFTGRLVEKTATKVIFEAVIGSGSMRMSFPTTLVREIKKGALPKRTPTKRAPKRIEKPKVDEPEKEPEPRGPSYVVIPFRGEVGLGITADLLSRSFKIAKAARPDVVIVRVNSPGGSIRELQKMIKVLHEYDTDLRVVAYVEKAYSAAAVFSMSCKEIIVGDPGTIGGAVVFTVGAYGIPTNIGEKWESIIRAEFRTAVKRAGHSEKLLEGMMRTDVELYVVETEEGPKVVEKKEGGAKVVKKFGRVLTLDAEQAMQVGLAAFRSDELKDAWKDLGFEEEWHAKRNDVVQAIFTKWDEDCETAIKEFKELWDKTKELLDIASAHDPRQIMYIPTSSGKMPHGAKQTWMKQARICLEACKRAEANVAKLQKIAEDYEGLVAFDKIDFSKEQLEELRDRIKSYVRHATTPPE